MNTYPTRTKPVREFGVESLLNFSRYSAVSCYLGLCYMGNLLLRTHLSHINAPRNSVFIGVDNELLPFRRQTII